VSCLDVSLVPSILSCFGEYAYSSHTSLFMFSVCVISDLCCGVDTFNQCGGILWHLWTVAANSCMRRAWHIGTAGHACWHISWQNICQTFIDIRHMISSHFCAAVACQLPALNVHNFRSSVNAAVTVSHLLHPILLSWKRHVHGAVHSVATRQKLLGTRITCRVHISCDIICLLVLWHLQRSQF